MSKQLFGPQADTFLWSAVVLLALSAVFFWPIRDAIQRSSYVTNVGVSVPQVVPFSHAHHVGDIGIDCRYCHASVQQSDFAGMPSSETCMGCHRYLWKSAPLLAPVRSSVETEVPLEWNRVNELPDYVYFSHRAHVQNGVGCEECHGRVDQMPLLYKARSLLMEDCLSCHRNPGPHLRPNDKIFALGAKSSAAEGEKLLKEYQIPTSRLLECVTCHR